MFTSPQSITVDSISSDLHRTLTEKTSSTYSSSDGSLALRISHQETKTRIRHLARLDNVVVAADPLTAENSSQKAGVYLVIDEPLFGFDDADLDNLVDAITGWLTASNIAALLQNRH